MDINKSLFSWDLSDLVEDHKDKKFDNFLKVIEEDVNNFQQIKNELNANITSKRFEIIIKRLEDIYERMNIAGAYANLLYASDTSSNEAGALVTKIDKLSSELQNKIIFFDIWFKKELDEENAQRIIKDISIEYQEYFKHKRKMAKYSLSEVEEKIINTLDVTSSEALVKIYDRMTNNFEFELQIIRDRKKIKKVLFEKEKLVSLIRSPKKEEREAAYKALWKVYSKNSGILGEIYINLAQRWRDEYINIRKFDSPISVRNLSNDLDDKTVNSLLNTCRKNSKIFHQYFILKAKILGMRKLQRYHLYAPLSFKSSHQKKWEIEKAAEMVIDTFKSFNPKFKEYVERIIQEKHVDADIRRGKQGGAFCYTVAPRRTPYVLLNFDGKTRDISTMAHEFGHAIHSMCASDKPILVSHAPLPLAETASVFAEMLLNERLLENMSKKEKIIHLAEQIDDIYATVMRQAYFTMFEIEAHNAVEGNATIDKISEIYLNNLKEQFGDSVIISDDFKWEWTYIPHFYHTPFYCYAYSFGNLLVLSLYQKYKEEGDRFVDSYIEILSSGGTKKPEELLKDHGLDITDEEFWQFGFNLIAKKIKELEILLNEK